jgi:hypothetical protein
MAITLYDASVANFLQTLDAVGAFMEKGLAHCREHNIDPEQIVETRLHPDMLPFRFQIQSVARHSADAVESVRSGIFSPPFDSPAHDYRALQGLIADAAARLRKVTPADVNAQENGKVLFQVRDIKMEFTAPAFLQSFSLPNFHFHATTAYDILRSKGVPVGKRDYLGTLRFAL